MKKFKCLYFKLCRHNTYTPKKASSYVTNTRALHYSLAAIKGFALKLLSER